MIATKRSKPTPEQLALDKTVKIRRILVQLGFDKAARLPEHDAIIEQLADLVPHQGFHSRPLETVDPKHKDAVLALLKRLPQVKLLEAAAATVAIRHNI